MVATNEIYDDRNALLSNSSYPNLPVVRNDEEKIIKGLRTLLGARDDEIWTLRDKSYAEFEHEIKNIAKIVEKNYQIGRFHTLVWWYYAGHGSLKAKTAIVCNKGPAEHEFFPIEE